MRVKHFLLLFGLSAFAQAEVNIESDALPDAALLEFLADWHDEDQDWLDGQMMQDQFNRQDGEADMPATSAQETSHE